MPAISSISRICKYGRENTKENTPRVKPLLESLTPKSGLSSNRLGSPASINKKNTQTRGFNMVQAARQGPKPPSFLSGFNTQRSPMREDSPNNKLQQLPNITVTVCTKAVKKEALSPRPLSLGSPPPSGKASRSYSSDASDEDQHKAKKFKRAEVKEPHLVGFKNQGATCYMNCILQALSGVESFYAEVLHELPIMSSQLCALQSLFRVRNEGRENMVYMCLQEIHSRFANEVDSNFKGTHDQQDLDEFLTLYLDKIDSQIKQSRKELDYFESSPTLVETNFPFKDLEKRICKKCQNEITSEQPHNILYVSLLQDDAPVTNNQKRSVQELVQSTMEGPWNDCINCKEFNSVKTTKKFTSLPKTLLIILMRYDKLGQKLETPVDICPYLCLDDYISSDCLPPPTVPICISKPLEHESIAVQTDIEPHDIINPDTPETDNEETALKDAKAASMQEQWAIENQEAADIKRALEESIADLDPFQHRPDAKVVYKLSAVVNHYGATPSSGHYKCDVFRKEKMQWFNYNDLSVRSRSPERVLKGAEEVCYLLVYQLDGKLDGFNVKQESDAGVTTFGDESYVDHRASPEPQLVKDESTSSFFKTDFS